MKSRHLIFLWNLASKYWLFDQFYIYFHTCIKTLYWWYYFFDIYIFRLKKLKLILKPFTFFWNLKGEWDKIIISSKVVWLLATRKLNPILTRLCHVISCCDDKSNSSLLRIGLRKINSVVWTMKLLYTQGRCDIHCSATRQPMTVVCHHTPQRTRFMSIAGPPESIGTWGSEPHQFWADKWELLYLGGQNIPTNFFHILTALMSIGGQGTLLHHNSYSPA